MATLSFNKDNRIDDFTFILVRKDNYNIGTIHARDVNFNHNFNGPDEISLKVYKDLNPKFNKYWDRLNDYNDLYVPELGTDGYFEIEVTLNEDSEGIYKTVTGTSRCESELSHTKIYTYEINSDDEMIYDEQWDENNVTRLYRDPSQNEAEVESIQAVLDEMSLDDPDYENTKTNLETAKKNLYNTKHRSIMHRLLDKLPNYSIDHVDQTLTELTDWYQFTWDDQSVYDIMTGDLADNYHVLFKFDSKNRKISLYDLYTVCMNDNCDYRIQMQEDRNITTRYRGDFHHVCPKCGSKNVTEGYGKFTKIIVSKDNLMNSAQVSSNKDNLINCFKVKGGDELLDAAVVNQNPNGSDYFYQFSDENMTEMPPELVQKIKDYQDEYNLWYQGDIASDKGIYTFTEDEVNQINELISYCKDTFNKTTVQDFIELKPQYIGYQSLASQFYSLLDLEAFYRASMFPDLKSSPNDSIDETFAKLTVANLSPLAVFDPSTAVLGSVESALIQRVKCIINTSLYTVEVVNSGEDSSYTKAQNKDGTGTWRGKLKIAQIDKVGTKEESEYTRITDVLSLSVDGNVKQYVTQQIEAMVKRKDTSLEDLNVILRQELDYIKQYDQTPPQTLIDAFENKLDQYSLEQLTKVVRPCYSDVLTIINQQGAKINSIYFDFYNNHLKQIDEEIKKKTESLDNIQAVLDKVEAYRQETKDALNFASYLGDNLYKVFCNYRREDTYSNDNYISADLDNGVIMRRAGDLIDAAQKELYKASHLQFDVTGNLNNLLALPEFTPIKDDFEVGNWIKMSVDDVLYDLRLLSYSINFGELQSINIDFSTVEKIWSGASDIQSVLQSAGSIAGSYSIVQNKVKENDKSSKLVNNWVNDGLMATMTKFANDPIAQEIVYDSTGLYARSYDDSTGEYLPQQLKIVKNGMYLTSDNWDHIKTGVGAITYVDPRDGNKTVDAYGIIGDAIVGKLLLGEELVIANSDNNFIVDKDGMKISNGTNTFSVNPNSTTLLSLTNGSNNLLAVDNTGNLSVTGVLTANANSKIGPWIVGDSYIRNGNIANATNTTVSGVYLGTSGLNISGGTAATTTYITKSAVNIGDKLKWNGTTLTVNGDVIATKLTATSSGTIGPWSMNGTSLYKKGGYNSATAGSAYLGDSGISVLNKFVVTSGGVLTATGADITGTVTATTLTATSSGTIGPWQFNGTSLYKAGGWNSSTVGSAYLGNNGISITDKFQVSADGTTSVEVLYVKNGSFWLTNASGSQTSQHVQMGTEFIYIGDNNTARLNIRTNGIYYQTGNYYASLDVDRSCAIKFITLATGSTGFSPTVQIRGYGGDFLVPVGSAYPTDRQCYYIATRSDGEMRVTGCWGATTGGSTYKFVGTDVSDKRLKKNIANSNINALNIVNQIKPVSFNWRKDGKYVDLGFIAQDLEQINSNLVYPPDNDFKSEDAFNYYSINTYYLQAVGIKAIQEQQTEITNLQQEIVALKKTIKELNGGKNYED